MNLQVIVYLKYLALPLQVTAPGYEITNLIDRTSRECSQLKLVGEGSVLGAILGKVESLALQGLPITSWAGELGESQCLNDSNSAIGATRCLVADIAIPGNFILLDKIGIDEVLYTFDESEVDRLNYAVENGYLTLVFKDSTVARRFGHHLALSREPMPNAHVTQWVDRFLSKFQESSHAPDRLVQV